ncbi:MAG: hydantoinase/oxoprolinase N-terminal domain-containing protein, partial [Anaerolineales bacterium]|nr:hydantoinase/oxoprolinase N-terminal domain-containing protein [Anaerolineales bacterium]
MRIGIDVGGTNTDAVLMDGLNIVTSSKTPTTADVTGGILSAVRQVQAQSGVQPDEIDAIMLGTTHFTNAIVEGKRLTPTAVIRLGAPATVALPPLVDWPQRLRDTLGKHTFIARGGYEFDGRQIAALDEKEIRDCARQIADKGVTAVAISCVFSPVNVEMEETAAAIVREEIPAARVTASHNIGRLGLLPRENAAVLNACVSELAQQTIESFTKALGEFQLKA